MTPVTDPDLLAQLNGPTPVTDPALLEQLNKPQTVREVLFEAFKELQKGKDEFVQHVGNAAAGAVRGAGSIGATLVAPYDIAKDAINGKGLSLDSNMERRQGMDDALRTMGADPDSWMYKGGKLAGEIAGTAGAGGALAKGAQALGAAPSVVTALQTAGMTTGNSPIGFAAKAADMALRTGAGAAVGGTAAGLVNPKDAVTGAVIGGAAPAVITTAGKIGQVIGDTIRGPAQSPKALEAIKKANDLGYVIPPSQAKPTIGNRTLEGFAGKISTAQNASAQNAGVTNSLAAKALGLPKEAQITPEVLNDIRKVAGDSYEVISNTGTITPGKAYTTALDKIAEPYIEAAKGFPKAKASPVIDLIESLKSPSFDARSAVSKIKELRELADDAYAKGDKFLGSATKSAAKALENTVEEHLSKIGSPELLQQFRDGRQLIAKTYTVQKALNPTTGTIDANKLKQLLDRNKPLTGELRDIAEFAQRFPKAAQTSEKMGSLPQTSPLDWVASGAVSAATHNPTFLATVMGRPLARKLALSDMVQGGLSTPANSRLSALLGNKDAQQLMYRAAPIIADH